MEHEKLAKKLRNFVISHAILPQNLTNFAPKCYQICIFFITAKKWSSNQESLHFPAFSEKCRECEIGKRDGHGKSRNGHGKVMEKYVVKYVGTLIRLGSPHIVCIPH